MVYLHRSIWVLVRLGGRGGGEAGGLAWATEKPPTQKLKDAHS